MREDAPEKLRILSLDGGDARCMSQLEILKEFMHRLNTDTGVDYRPCDYFHWIGGAGAGGVVAVLLVTLSMSADEASLAFAQICDSVLQEEQCTPSNRAEKLERITRILLEEHNLSSDSKLLEQVKPTNGCKLGLFYMAAVNMGRCALFRNYQARQASYNPTIVEAVRVVWATPGLFSSVQVGPGIVQEELVSASSGFNNPTLEVLKEVHQTFGPDATVSCLLSLGAGRAPISSVSADGIVIPKALKQLAMDGEKTAEEVERRVGRLGVYFRFSVDRGLEFDKLSLPVGKITAHAGQYLLDSTVSKNIDSCIRSCEKESRVSLDQIYHSRAKSSTSLCGLPPLTAFFVMRQGPMDVLIKNLVENKSSEQHVMVLAGMGGSGKTQLTLKFARDFEDRFQPIMFIDASSADTIKKGLLTRIRALGREYAPETVEDGLQILADPDDPAVRNWLIIYDNADDPELDLRQFIPTCDNGTILITTRNTMLRHMTPDGYLELDVMSAEEAITALLQAALPSGVKPTTRDREAATTISQQLGYLPIAIIQAGCYIMQQQCLYEYEDRLKANRKTTLERPAKNQRDALKYGHSVYAALDITLEALSQGTRHLLRLLSSVHFANFPRPLISVAAKSGFSLEIIKLLDRPPSFQTTIDFLNGLFCPNGSWDENILGNFLEELQQYSLVSLVSSTPTVTFRLHPLVQSWAQDRMSPGDQEVYRAAAVRLIACAAGQENYFLYDYLGPHIMSLSAVWPSLHVNDRIALLRILDEDEDSEDAPLVLERAQGVYDEVKTTVGEGDARALRAALFLATAHGSNNDLGTMEKMQTEIVSAYESLLGREDLATATAMLDLARSYLKQDRQKDAETLLDEVLKLRRKKLGDGDIDTVEAMEAIALVYKAQDRSAEAQRLLEAALETRRKLFGRADIMAIVTMMHLADLLDRQDRQAEADSLRQEALTLENTHLGNLHIGTLWTMIWMGGAYSLQKRFDEAEKMFEQALAGFKEVQGAEASDTLDAMGYLAATYDKQGRFVDSESLRKDELLLRRQTRGNRDIGTLDTLLSLAFFYTEQGRPEDQLNVAKEVAEGKQTVLGDLHLETIVSFSLLGNAYQKLGQFREAEEVRRYELDLRKAFFGYEHPGTFAVIGAIAQAVFDQKRVIEAETLWREEIDGRRKLQDGTLDSDLLAAINSLSFLVYAQGRYAEAEILATEIQDVRKNLLGDDHVDTLRASQWLGCVYLDGRKFPEADKIWDDLLPKQKIILGEDNLDTLMTHFYIGRTKYDQRKWAEAEAIWSELLQKRKDVQGEKHIDVITLLQWLAACAFEQGRPNDAINIHETDLALKMEVLGIKDVTLYETMERLAYAYHKAGRNEDAEKAARNGIKMGEEILGLVDPMTIRARGLLAIILHEQGRFSEAATIIEQALKERISLWGESHIMVARSKSRLAIAYEALGRCEEAKVLAEEAVVIQRKELRPDNIMLKETLEILEKLDSQQAVESHDSAQSILSPKPIEVPNDPVLVAPVARKRPVREETIDIDGYQSPGEDLQQTLRPPHVITRPISPFEQRNKFGRSPNPWSMFM